MVCHVISQWTFKKPWKRQSMRIRSSGWLGKFNEWGDHSSLPSWKEGGGGEWKDGLICTEFCVTCSWDYLWYLISGQAISREHCSTKLFLIGSKQRDAKQSNLRTAGCFPKEWTAVWSANAFFRWIREHQTVQPSYLFWGRKKAEVSGLASFYTDLALELLVNIRI